MYTAYINRLTVILRAFGWTVDPYAFHLGDGVLGRAREDLRLIELNCSSALVALLTLAHETGHVIDYARRGTRFVGKPRREKLAYLYGWLVLKHLGCPVTKEQWRSVHFD